MSWCSGKKKFADFCRLFIPDHSGQAVFQDIKNNCIINSGEIFKDICAVISACSKEHGKALLFLDSGRSFLSALFGCLASGIKPVLINNKLRQEISLLAGLYDFIITNQEYYEIIREYAAPDTRYLLVDSLAPGIADYSVLPSVDSSDTALYLFTSGSTGAPKLVAKTFDNLYHETAALADFFKIRSSDIFYPLVPAFHIYGLLFEVLLPLFCGSSIILNAHFSPTFTFEKIIQEKKATVIIASPLHFQTMSGFLDSYKKDDFTFFRHCVSSTMAMDVALAESFYRKLGMIITEIYGSTETGGIAFRRYAHNSRWKFFDFVSHRLDRENVLSVSSPTVSLPEGGESWYATGDVIEGDRQFNLLGRVNQIIKSAGNRVSAVEIENALKKSGLVNDAAVIAKKCGGLRGEAAAAYVVPAAANEHIIEELKKAMCNLPEFKRPHFYKIMNEIPRGPGGKVFYKNLPEI
ncbi:MAG: hypothetical protein A2096_10245 [Spirochaetes bacterium GWF1_41_5]|nr:MAG: hypothetical protein A2096_10245 [Spirochaetes bacterium GWF1_41_5]